jgi:transcriptional regulator with XRE-family HTH domain/tetratricopeptide (TPR) repeat protein
VGIGEVIAARRAELGLTQAALADALNAVSGRPTLTRHDVSRWERGAVTPRYWLPYLATVLDVPLARLRLAVRDGDDATPADVARVALEWLVSEPPQVAARRAGRRVGAGLVRQLRGRVAELRRLDDHIAGGDTHTLVTRELATTLRLIDEASYTEATGRGLFVVAGELAQLAGWVVSDAGMPRKASGYYLTGLRAATQAGDRAGAANNLSSLAYQTANAGSSAEAVTLARAAAAGASGATPKVRALLTERVAWAHARAGQHSETERALGTVDELLTADTVDEPAWVYWLDRAEADVMAGRCYTELRRPLRAVPLLEQATADYRNDAPRELALYLSWLAVAYADARELDAACSAAHRMIRLSKNVSSARTRDRLHRVVGTLRAFSDEPQVRELIDRSVKTKGIPI